MTSFNLSQRTVFTSKQNKRKSVNGNNSIQPDYHFIVDLTLYCIVCIQIVKFLLDSNSK